MHVVTRYALEVVNGERIAGQTEIQACQRHLNDLERQGTPDFPYIFVPDKADRLYFWYANCTHVEGPLALRGETIDLIDAHKFDIGSIFGWYHAETGERRFRKCYIQEARKNAKTTRLAPIALYFMAGDGVIFPTVFCAAVDREQARIMYEIAASMAENSPKIAKYLKIGQYKITHRTRGGKMVAFSKGGKNKDGRNPVCAIIDEYAFHPTSEVYSVMDSSFGMLPNTLLAVISTAGYDTESACYQEYKYCKDIVDPSNDVVQNERYFVMIREMDKGDDIHDPENWKKANPLKATDPLWMESLQEKHDEAYGSGIPDKILEFRVKLTNEWVHATSQHSYMGHLLEKWDSLAVSREEFLELTRGLDCNTGYDLSKRIDLTADAHIFHLPDGRLAVTAHGFVPEDTVKEHERTDKIQYRHYASEGWCTITDGAITDHSVVRARTKELEKINQWSVYQAGFDPYDASETMRMMTDEGYTVYEVRQGVVTLSEPTKLFRDLVADGKVVHDGNPLLRWCIANAEEYQDNNENIKISKKNTSSTRRVDLLTAILNAMVQYPALKQATLLSDWLNSDDFGFS